MRLAGCSLAMGDRLGWLCGVTRPRSKVGASHSPLSTAAMDAELRLLENNPRLFLVVSAQSRREEDGVTFRSLCVQE